MTKASHASACFLPPCSLQRLQLMMGFVSQCHSPLVLRLPMARGCLASPMVWALTSTVEIGFAPGCLPDLQPCVPFFLASWGSPAAKSDLVFCSDVPVSLQRIPKGEAALVLSWIACCWTWHSQAHVLNWDERPGELLTLPVIKLVVFKLE